jgi:hypothetical protein
MTDDLLTPPTDPNYLEELVGDNKKFKSAEELAKGKYIADNYIQTLESQLDQLRSDYIKLNEEQSAKAGLQELIDKMNSQKPVTPDITKVPDVKPTIDPKQIEDLIDSRMSQREQARRESENVNLVKNKLQEKWGKEYHNSLQQRISDIDLTSDQFNQMAKNNPKTLIKLLELDSQQQVPSRDPFAPPRSHIRSDNFKPKTETRDWAWYQDLKVKDPKKYYSPATNVQMHKDALELGAAFETGDFNRFDKDYRINY